MIKRLLRLVGRWARKPVNHTSWVGVVTPTDRPKSVRNSCLIELFCGVVYVVTLSLWHFCWYRGFCHRTGSDLLLFVLTKSEKSLVIYMTKVIWQLNQNVCNWLWRTYIKNQVSFAYRLHQLCLGCTLNTRGGGRG